MNFRSIEAMILEREEISSKIRALRILEIRRTYNLIVSNPTLNSCDSKRIRKNFATMEKQVLTAHLRKAEFDSLLDELEGDLDVFAQELLGS